MMIQYGRVDMGRVRHHRTIIYQLSFPVLSLCPGLQLLLEDIIVYVTVTMNFAALPLSTVLGQFCDVKCHSP